MTYKDEGNGASDESLKTYKVLRTGDLAFEGHTNKDFRYGRFVANVAKIQHFKASERYACIILEVLYSL